MTGPRADMVRRPTFPFPGGRFPADLGVVVQRTVLQGEEPARIVVHDADGDWAVADGRHDPNEPEACEVTHMRHLLDLDATLEVLASMPPGRVAERDTRNDPWRVHAHRYEED